MAKMNVTWLGEDDQHFEVLYDERGVETGRRPAPGPSFMYWGDLRFDKDKPTLVDSEEPGMTAERKLLVDNILKRTPNMKKRFKVEPVVEKQEEARRGNIRQP